MQVRVLSKEECSRVSQAGGQCARVLLHVKIASLCSICLFFLSFRVTPQSLHCLSSMLLHTVVHRLRNSSEKIRICDFYGIKTAYGLYS